MRPGFFENVVNAVAMRLLDDLDGLRGMPTQAGENLANLLRVYQRLGGLGFHERHQRDAIGPGDHETRVCIADHPR